jgi:integrase
LPTTDQKKRVGSRHLLTADRLLKTFLTMNKASNRTVDFYGFLRILVLEYRTHVKGGDKSTEIQTLLYILKAFCKHNGTETLNFEDINEAFFRDFDNYAFKVKKYRLHTYKKYVENIIFALKLAKNRGLYESSLLFNSLHDVELNKVIHPIYHSRNVKPLQYDNDGVFTFNGFVENYLLERSNVYSKRDIQSLQSRLRLLNHFASDILNQDSLNWCDFNAKFPLKFQEWCYAAPREYSKNYVARLFKHVRTWLKVAQQEGIKGITNDYKATIYLVANCPIDSVALNFKEVKALANLDLEDNERLTKIKDIFVFGCLTGLRYSDISRIGKLNFTTINKSGSPLSIIDVITKKTGERVNVPLHDIAKDIIKRNGGTLPRVPSNQKYNSYLKELCEFAEMTETVQLRKSVGGKSKVKESIKFENITSHTARRTFATIAYMEFKMPIVLIMKMTGHKSEKEFLKYVQMDRTSAAIEISNYFKS